MESTMAAIEMTGVINKHRQLQLDAELPVTGPKRVRVIVLYPLSDEENETEWLRTAACNPAFDFLNDPEEDICLPEDGKAFHD